MNRISIRPAPRATGFTLIELLVVIGIIAVLAAILLPTLGHAKTVAKKRVAKMEIVSLAAAIQAYEEEYKKPPMPKEAEQEVYANAENYDFTYATPWTTDHPIHGCPVRTYGDPPLRNQPMNDELMAILRGKKSVSVQNPTRQQELETIAQARNPRGIVFFEPKLAASDTAPGLCTDGILRDPWGTPYIISLDMNDDGQTFDGFYGDVRKNSPSGIPEVKATVMVWSLGPDRKALVYDENGNRLGEKDPPNKDNILSWD